MLMPLLQLVKRSLVIYGVTKDADLGSTQEKMSQVVHRSVACSIPNIQLQFMSSTLLVLNVDHFSEVLHHICLENLSATHRASHYKRIYNRRFAHVRVTHEDDFLALFRLLRCWLNI